MVSFHWCVLSEPHIEDALQRERQRQGDENKHENRVTNGQVGCAVFVTMQRFLSLFYHAHYTNRLFHEIIT